MTYILYPFAVIGFAAVVLLAVGLWLDISDFCHLALNCKIAAVLERLGA